MRITFLNLMIAVVVLMATVLVYVSPVTAADVVLDVNSITGMSDANVAIIDDPDASTGKAVEFQGGANNPLVADPTAYFEMEFDATAEKHYIWVRAKANDDNTGGDSLWIQFDDEIGTNKGDRFPARGMGNWMDVFPPGEYVWSSNEVPPATVVSFTFSNAGKHILRAQPRQAPHQIDQILLSTTQEERPDSEPRSTTAVDSAGKLATAWGKIKAQR